MGVGGAKDRLDGRNEIPGYVNGYGLTPEEYIAGWCEADDIIKSKDI